MKSGFVSIIGRPNVGKSTLLNYIIGKKIAIISDKPQTTRNIIQGIYTKNDTQIIFVDTPGIHKPKNKLGKVLNKQTYFSINDVDIILFMVDISESLGKGDLFIIDLLKREKKPVFLILNKIDKLNKEQILVKIDEYKDLYNFDEIFPLSAYKGDNVDRLIDTIKKYLPDNIKYFDDDMITASSDKFIIAELIREKILELTSEEIPHSVCVVVDNLEENKKIISIYATIVLDRENIKKIIIGRNGNMIKEISTRSRCDLEEYFKKKVYLETYVKVIPKWSDKEKYLNQIRFNDFME